MQPKNGLVASGRTLLNTAVGDKQGNKARDRFYHLLLDSLKKDYKAGVKQGLASAAISAKVI